VPLSVNLVKSMITDVMDVVLDKVVGQEGAVVINSAYVMHVLVRYYDTYSYFSLSIFLFTKYNKYGSDTSFSNL
jgi:hypothetical protein